MTFLPTPSTRAYLSFLPWRTPPNFPRKLIWIAAAHADGSYRSPEAVSPVPDLYPGRKGSYIDAAPTIAAPAEPAGTPVSVRAIGSRRSNEKDCGAANRGTEAHHSIDTPLDGLRRTYCGLLTGPIWSGDMLNPSRSGSIICSFRTVSRETASRGSCSWCNVAGAVNKRTVPRP